MESHTRRHEYMIARSNDYDWASQKQWGVVYLFVKTPRGQFIQKMTMMMGSLNINQRFADYFTHFP